MKSFMTKLLMGVVILTSSFLFSGCNLLERKNKAGLQVITNDVVVSIFVDGEYLAKTPYLTKDLKPGEYTIKLEPEDKKLTTYETTLNLRKGMLSVITWKPGITLTESGGVIYELEKLSDKNKTELSVLSIPDGAIISIDGKGKQFAPYLEEDISVGNHEFEVSLPSYETQKHTINIVKGHRLNILVKLAKDNVLHFDDKPEPTPKPTPTPTPTPSNIQRRTTTQATTSGEVKGVTTSDAPQPSSRPVRQAVGTPSATTQKVLIKKTGYIVQGKEVLKVRDSSTSAGKVIGLVESSKEYPYLGQQTQNWIKLSIGDKEGWVSSLYAQVTN